MIQEKHQERIAMASKTFCDFCGQEGASNAHSFNGPRVPGSNEPGITNRYEGELTIWADDVHRKTPPRKLDICDECGRKISDAVNAVLAEFPAPRGGGN